MAGGRGFETTTGLVIQQGIFEESTSAKHRVGTRMQLADGRVYYYASTAEATVAGKLCFSKPMDAANTAMIVTNNGAAVGAKSLVGMLVGATAFTANEFAEGFMYTQKVAAEGYTYKIKSNTSGSAAGTATIELYDPIQVAITVATEIGFAYNPFTLVSSASAVVTSAPAGVSPRGVITSGSYGWLQTWGVCAMQMDENVALSIGHKVHASTEEGAVAAYASDMTITTRSMLSPAVGYLYGAVAVDAEWTPVMLQLYP